MMIPFGLGSSSMRHGLIAFDIIPDVTADGRAERHDSPKIPMASLVNTTLA